MNTASLLAVYGAGVRSKAIEYREKLNCGGVRWIKLTVELVSNPNSQDILAYLMFENIDKEKRAALEIKAHAETDPLTGLYNRSVFAEKTGELLRSRRDGTLCALLLFDLDNFKKINDSGGHMAGDKALVETAGKLRAALRSSDLVGRLGGDEFLVCLNDIPDRSVIDARAKAFCELLRACGQLTASVGISVSPDDGANFGILYMKADAALYHAKRSGKNSYCFYSDDMGVQNVHI